MKCSYCTKSFHVKENFVLHRCKGMAKAMANNCTGSKVFTFCMVRSFFMNINI